ncbi:MAG: O-antigen ligase family protein [bacterium]
MLLVIVYLIGCLLGGLYSHGLPSRRLAWVLLAATALLCLSYLSAGQNLLPGLSLFSLSSSATHSTQEAAAPWHAPIPGLSWLLHLVDSTVANAFALVTTLKDSAAAGRVGFALYLLGAATILVQPRYGLYLILFGALVGDAVLLPWYPFVKGFSSPESLFFIDDWLIVSPLELYVVLTAISWSARAIRQGKWSFRTGPLFSPALVFAAALLVGLAYGVGTGGDPRIALWEARAVFYLVPLLLLTSNLVDTPAQVTGLLWVALAAVCIKGIVGSLYYLVVLRGDLNGVEGIAEHGAAVHLNALLVTSVGVLLYETSRLKKILLPLMVPFVLLGYIAMQRRAAFVSVAIAFVLMLAVLYKQRRRLFWKVAPAFLLLGGGYVAAAWNSQNTLAIPAHAIKSAIVARQASDRDQSSNDYRLLENQNIGATIRQHPLMGVGFGQKYLMAVPLPDLSRFFEWWEYITHNSILWIWMKAGLVGVLSMLVLIGLAIVSGARAVDRLPADELGLVTLAATLYLVMHFIYACVDMSWDAASIVFVGTLMGVVNCAEWIAPAVVKPERAAAPRRV